MRIILTDLTKYNAKISQEVIDAYNSSDMQHGSLRNNDDPDYLTYASHVISNVELKDEVLYGDIKVLSTLCGKFLSRVFDDKNLNELQLRINTFCDDDRNITHLLNWNLDLPYFDIFKLHSRQTRIDLQDKILRASEYIQHINVHGHAPAPDVLEPFAIYKS